MKPSKEQAEQFAVMLSVGMPPSDAIQYFLDGLDETQVADAARMCDLWVRDKEVQAAVLKIQGKSFQDMGLMERLQFSVNKTYTEMAYFLYSHNYGELSTTERQKADTCRATLEAKLAGNAGKMSPIESLWNDILAGKVKVKGAPTAVTVQ